MAVRVTQIATGKLSSLAAAVGTIPVDRFNEIAFTLTGLTAETLTIEMSCDNGVTWSTNHLGVTPMTGAAVVTTIPSTSAAGYYARIPACTHLKFVKSAGAETVVLAYCLRQS